MKQYNVDFHMHGPFAAGTSKNLSVEKNAEMGYYKGLDVVPVGDLTHKPWFDLVFSKLEVEDEVWFYRFKDKSNNEKRISFVLSTEVQLNDRSHHLVIFPDKKKILEFREKIKPFSKGLDGVLDGRPWLKINSKQFAKICVDLELIFGPAHAFTPYFGVYAHFDSLKDAYGEYFEDMDFLELGLSADGFLANNIEELKNKSFLSNSDAHSFWPNKLGREFNRILLEKPSFYEFKKAFNKKDGRKITLNVGLNPKEGKYHMTACNKCYKIYSWKKALELNRRCSCGGIIKKGVYDKIMELAHYKIMPYNRPDYKYILPLSEIIALQYATKNVLSKKVQSKWWEMVEKGNSEINILLDMPEKELFELDNSLYKYILAFRNNFVVYKPGGGGNYGEPIITFSKDEKRIAEKKIEDYIAGKDKAFENKQKTLF